MIWFLAAGQLIAQAAGSGDSGFLGPNAQPIVNAGTVGVILTLFIMGVIVPGKLYKETKDQLDTERKFMRETIAPLLVTVNETTNRLATYLTTQLERDNIHRADDEAERRRRDRDARS